MISAICCFSNIKGTSYNEAQFTFSITLRVSIWQKDDIFSMIDEEKRSVYDKNYIENLYIQYMDTGNVQEEHLAELKTMIKGKEVLIIASGRSTIDEKEKVLACASRENIVTIGINFDYTEFSTDFIFKIKLKV